LQLLVFLLVLAFLSHLTRAPATIDKYRREQYSQMLLGILSPAGKRR
jgi:hypothetical protein